MVTNYSTVFRETRFVFQSLQVVACKAIGRQCRPFPCGSARAQTSSNYCKRSRRPDRRRVECCWRSVALHRRIESSWSHAEGSHCRSGRVTFKQRGACVMLLKKKDLKIDVKCNFVYFQDIPQKCNVGMLKEFKEGCSYLANESCEVIIN